MAIKLCNALLTAQGAAVISALKGGSLNLYSTAGQARPVPTGSSDGTFTAASGRLISIPLSSADPVAGTIDTGGLPITVTVATPAGTTVSGAGADASWYALLTSGGALVATGSVGTIATGTDDLMIASTYLANGATFQLAAGAGTFVHKITR